MFRDVAPRRQFATESYINVVRISHVFYLQAQLSFGKPKPFLLEARPPELPQSDDYRVYWLENNGFDTLSGDLCF